MKFPMYLTFYAMPGYNISMLESFGFYSEKHLFQGKSRAENDTTYIFWGNETISIQGKVFENFLFCVSVYEMK